MFAGFTCGLVVISSQTNHGRRRQRRLVKMPAAVLVLRFVSLIAIAYTYAAAAAGRAGYDRKLLQQVSPELHTVKLDIGPLRQYWEEHHGYCGEMSLQQAGAYFGHWISQRAARWLGGGEVLLAEYEGENMRPLIQQHLGFNHTDFREQLATQEGLHQYVVFFKRAVAAGLPAILAARIEEGESDPPEAYDHIMPLYGFTSPSLDTYTPEDSLTWTTGLEEEITRSVSDDDFFADTSDSCAYSLEEGGCFNSNPSTVNNAVAIAGLYDKHRVYLPMQLVVTGWTDSTPAQREPRDGTVTGSYSLNLTRAGPFAAAEKFTIFRFDSVTRRQIDPVISSGTVLANLTGAAAAHTLCDKAAAACRRHTVHVVQPGLQVLPHAEQQLGPLMANSVVYFVAVKNSTEQDPSNSPVSR